MGKHQTDTSAGGQHSPNEPAVVEPGEVSTFFVEPNPLGRILSRTEFGVSRCNYAITLIAGLQAGWIGPLLPLIAQAQGFPLEQAGILPSALNGGCLVALLFSKPVISRFADLRTTLISSFFLMAGFCGLAGLGGLAPLTVSMLCYGFGAGLNGISSHIYFPRYYPHKVASALSSLNVFFGLGALFGPMVVLALFYCKAPYNWIFAGASLYSLCLFAYMGRTVQTALGNATVAQPETAQAGTVESGKANSSTGHSSTAHSSTGHSSTAHSSTAHSSTAHSSTAHSSTAHSSTAHSSTAHSSTAHSSTGQPGTGQTTKSSATKSILGHPILIALVLINFLYVGTETSLGAWIYTYLQRVEGASGAIATAAVSTLWAGMTLGRIACTRACLKINPKYVTMAAMLILAGSIFASATIHLGGLTALPVVLMIGFGLGPIFPTIIAQSAIRFPAASSTTTTMVIAGGYFGGMLMPWLAGYAMRDFGAVNYMLITGLITLIMPILLGLALFPVFRKAVPAR